MAKEKFSRMDFHRSSEVMSADEIATELVFLKTGATKSYAFFREQLLEVQEIIPREFAEVCPEAKVGRG